jgi:hypothetical protein
MVEFVVGKVRGLAVTIMPAACGQDVTHCGSRAVMKIGGGAPDFDQSGCVESVGGPVEGPTRADIVLVKIGEERGRMTVDAAGAGKQRLTTDCDLGKFAMHQVRAGGRLESFQGRCHPHLRLGAP